MVRVSLIAVMLLVACNRHEAKPPPPKPTEPRQTAKVGSPVARGTLKRPKVETAYGVVVAAGSDLVALEKLAREKGPHLEVTRALIAGLFNDEQLTFLTKDLPQADVDRVKASAAVLMLHGTGTDGLKLARELAASRAMSSMPRTAGC